MKAHLTYRLTFEEMETAPWIQILEESVCILFGNDMNPSIPFQLWVNSRAECFLAFVKQSK